MTRTPVVMVVDDDGSLRAALARHLSRAGYAVLEAASGDEALARLAARTPDIVVLDLAMPGLSGGEVLLAIRKRHHELPVVIFSAWVHDSEVRTLLLEAGATAVCHKPDLQELADTINRCLCTGSNRGAIPCS